MVNINGFDFYEEPGICGTCPFLITGNTSVPGISCHSDRGLCIQWNEGLFLTLLYHFFVYKEVKNVVNLIFFEQNGHEIEI